MIRLKELREELNKDQKVLAIDLQVSQPTISDWENGRKTPSIENVIRLADYFHVSIDYLMYRSDTRRAELVRSDCWDGRHIRSLRQQRGETQKDVADAIGISVENYRKYECAIVDPPVEILHRLADHFCSGIDMLLDYSGAYYDSSGMILTDDFKLKSKQEQRLVEQYRLVADRIDISEIIQIFSIFKSFDATARKAVFASLEGVIASSKPPVQVGDTKKTG